MNVWAYFRPKWAVWAYWAGWRKRSRCNFPCANKEGELPSFLSPSLPLSMSYNTPPQVDAPNLRKRPSRGSSSKYITKPVATSPPPQPALPASPFPTTRNYATMDTSALTSSFMLSSPIMPTHMPVPSGSHSSFAAKRKAVKFPERNLPEKISTFIPESKLCIQVSQYLPFSEEVNDMNVMENNALNMLVPYFEWFAQ